MKFPLRRIRFFYGWVIVAVAFVSLAIIFGVRLSFSVFLVALTKTFGWSRSDFSGIYSINMIAVAAVLPFVGRLQDSWGARKLFAVGGITMAIALVLSSRIDSLWQLYIAYGLMTALGIAILSIGLHSAMVSRWFAANGRRGMAIGIALAGSGVGVLVLTPATERIISDWGWRAAYLALAALVLFVAVPLNWIFLRDSPEQIGLKPDGWGKPPKRSRADGKKRVVLKSWTWHSASRTVDLWALYLAASLALFSLRMVSVHQIAHMVDVGYSRRVAADAVGITGAVIAVSFIFWGTLSDHIGRHTAYALGGLSRVVAVGTLLALPFFGLRVWPLYFFALTWGISEGSCTSLLTALAADMFPGPAIGTIVGTMAAAFAIGSATGSWFGGFGFDVWGSYKVPFSLAIIGTLLSISLVLWLSHRISKLNEERVP